MRRLKLCARPLPGVTGSLLFLLTLQVQSFAQLPTATILGIVKDTSGAVVPDTNITAKDAETGRTRSIVSTADGSYRFSALPVGNYEIRAEHRGFQSFVRSGLTLTIGQEAVVNLTLEDPDGTPRSTAGQITTTVTTSRQL